MSFIAYLIAAVLFLLAGVDAANTDFNLSPEFNAVVWGLVALAVGHMLASRGVITDGRRGRRFD